MTGGYTGKILRLNLTNRSVSNIDTAQYEERGGGQGIGSAIFWDLAVAPGNWDLQDGLDPRNVLTMMVSPLSGTLAPGTSRTNVQGIGPAGYPVEWFTKSNFGGTFSAMLKFAGWDGIVIEGKADSPVWVKIFNGQVTIEDASDLWGLQTYAAQEKIWQRVTGNRLFSEWIEAGDAYTTMAPAVVCIGPAGENLVRNASLVHGSGSGSGQGGFGAVFGSKNLKAISVQGTGSVEVADPKALIDARIWLVGRYPTAGGSFKGIVAAVPPNMATSRQKGCLSCPAPCRRNSDTGVNNDSTCVSGGTWGTGGHDLGQRYGVNGFEGTGVGLCVYLKSLYDRGILGPGKAIDSAPLPMDLYGTKHFAEALLKTMSSREGIGADLAEGIMRATKKWGRLEEDLDSGLLPYPQWGYVCHWTLPGVEWPYGSLLDARDHDEHDFAFTGTKLWNGMDEQLTAEEFVNILAEKMIPYTGDPFMFDYGDGPTGIYSDHKVKLIAWHRHYTRFWKQSILYCDWVFPDFINADTPDSKGFTPEAEPKFFNAVTGKNITFADGMEIGRKIWNLDRAIWILQGRHRDMENFAPFLYRPQDPTVPVNRNSLVGNMAVPFYKDGKWSYAYHDPQDKANAYKPIPLYLDKDRFEEWRTMYYEFEGWETSSGWPTRATLEGLDLDDVADELQDAGKLGS